MVGHGEPGTCLVAYLLRVEGTTSTGSTCTVCDGTATVSGESTFRLLANLISRHESSIDTLREEVDSLKVKRITRPAPKAKLTDREQ